MLLESARENRLKRKGVMMVKMRNNDRESVEGRRSAVTGETTFMFHS